MRSFKKLIAFVASISMVLALTITGVKAEGYSITINNPAKGHTYEAYQIFTGDLSTNGVLSNIIWGTGVTDIGKTTLQSKYNRI